MITQNEQKTVESVDLSPVELDPPAPEIVRWQELADRDIEIIHDGDAEKVIPFPRPAWADPEEDEVGTSPQDSWYRATPVYVAALTGGGDNDGETLQPARFRVTARLQGSGQLLIGVRTERHIEGKWHTWGSSITPEGALELADVLRAAVDLVGGEK